MQELDDIALLREYAERDSEPAFEALVTRHIDRVYSVALRHTRNPHHAEEITQAVFVILATKAKHLRKGVILEGWLYQTARLTALTHIRSEIRRARREQEAHMQNVSNENESEAWTQIAPLLDAALAGLNETDRNAVVLRFFYGKSMGEIGTALGANEDTARMRINRAIEKLQKFFSKRGVNSTSEVISGAISTNSIQTAPAILAKAVTATAIAKGATASASTLTLIKGALKIMAWTKAKTIVTASIIALLAATTTTITVVEIHKHQAPKGPLSPSTVIGNAPDPSWTNSPLFMAIYSGDAAKVSALLDAHPEMLNEAVGEAGATPLHIAACYGHSSILSDLLQRGADINARTVHGHTALYDSIDRGHSTCATILLDHNADTTIKDDTGRTVYQLAVAGRHVTGIQTLQKYGITK